MKLRALALVPPLTAALVVLGGASPAAAAACSVQQLTETTGGTQDSPKISDDGTVVLWTSTGDLVGQNPDLEPELYRMDLTTGTIDQVTNTTDDEFLRGELSGDGDRVVFESRGEHGDGADNGDGSDEVFLWDESGDAGDILQLTNSGDDSHRPAINGDGTKIVFLSTADLTGDNPDGNQEVLLRDTAAVTTTQLTDSTSGSAQFPLIDTSGTRVVFASSADLTGDTPDGGRDLFRINLTTQTTSRLFDTTEQSIEPLAVDADASVIAYNAELDLTGENPDESYEIFVHRNGAGTTQVTDLPGGGDHYAEFAALDGAGERMSFESNADLVPGENPSIDDYQLFVHDAAGRVGFDQLTVGTSGTGDTDVSADGTRIVTEWGEDPVGQNADGNREIFLFTCGAPGPTYNDVAPANFFYEPIEWMAAADVAQGFPGGLFKPGDAVKRQQMANFLYNLAGQPEFTPGSPTFNDVPASNPFFTQIEWMVDADIANGFPGGLFKPGDPVKRQQMANFLYNLAGQPAYTPPATPTFTDVPASNPFFTQIEWMTAEGIANGFPGGLFKPNDPVKRQQMAQFLLNLVNGPGVGLL